MVVSCKASLNSNGILSGIGWDPNGHDVWRQRADSHDLQGKPMEIFNGGGGIQVGSMWDPCGIRMDFNGILLRIKWDPCGIPMDLKGTLRGIKWDPWGTHIG